MSEDTSEVFTFGEIAERFPKHLTEKDQIISVNMEAVATDFVLLAKMQGMNLMEFVGAIAQVWNNMDEVERVQ